MGLIGIPFYATALFGLALSWNIICHFVKGFLIHVALNFVSAKWMQIFLLHLSPWRIPLAARISFSPLDGCMFLNSLHLVYTRRAVSSEKSSESSFQCGHRTNPSAQCFEEEGCHFLRMYVHTRLVQDIVSRLH